MPAFKVSLLVLVAVCASATGAAASSDSDEMMSPSDEGTRDACIKELGLTPEETKTDDMPHTKVLTCIFKKDGVITADGKFSADAMLSRTADHFKMNPGIEAEVKKSIEKCRTELEAATGLKDEELAVKIASCMRKNRPKLTSSKAS